MTKCYSANGPMGPIEETVMIVLNKKTVFGYVPMNVESLLEIKLVLGLHAKVAPTSLVKMPMRRPSDVSKNNVSLKYLGTTEEAVESIQRPQDIPLKPSDKIVELISTVHSIHCQELLV